MELLPKATCYQFIRRIAEGACSSVYLAKDLAGANRVVKVFDKVLSSSLEPQAAARDFLRELEVSTSLSHPNLAALLDFGQTLDSGLDFLVFEHLQGGGFITASKEASVQGFYSLLIQVCRALDYLHARGIVHGDLKPSNILIVPGEGHDSHSPTVKLIDLAYSSVKSDRESRIRRGTPHYVAPEIIAGEPPTPASDLYSFGAVLYEALVGTPPFNECDVGMVLNSRLGAGSPRIHANSLVELHPIIHQLLARIPSKRPSSAAEVVRLINLVSPVGRFDLQTSETWSGLARSVPLVGRDHALGEASRLLSKFLPNNEFSDPFCFVLVGPKGSGKTRLAREIALQGRLFQYRPLHLVPSSVSNDSTSPHAILDAAVALTTSIPWLAIYDGVRAETVEDIETVMAALSKARRMSVIITVDSSEVPPDCVARIAQLLDNTHSFHRTELHPLSQEQVAKIISFVTRTAHVNQEVSAAFHSRSGGNPLLLAQLLSANLSRNVLVTRGGAITFDQQDENLVQPQPITSYVENLLGHLSPSDSSIIEVIAAAPEPLDPTDLASLAGIDTTEVTKTCALLASRGVLRPAGSVPGIRYTVSFIALKDSILSRLSTNQSRKLHEHMARWYLNYPDRGQALAHAALSFVASGRQPEALQYCNEAARRAAEAQDHRSAARFFRLALDHVSNDETSRTTIMLALVDSLVHLGQVNTALELLRSIKMDTGLSDRLLASLHLACANCARYTGDVHLHERAARNALTVARRANHTDLALKAMVELGTALSLSGRGKAGNRILHRTALRARREHLHTLAALATHAIASSYWRAGDSRSALRFERRVQRLSNIEGDYRSAAHSLVNIGILQSDLGRYRAARRSYKSAVLLGQRFDAQTILSRTANNVGETYRSQGRWPCAMRHYASARTRSRESGTDDLNLIAEANTALVFAQTGQYSEALRHLKHRMSKSRPLGHVQATQLLLSGWALLMSELGRHATSTRLSMFASSFADKAELTGSVLEMKVLLARSLAGMGKGTDARVVLSDAISAYGRRSPFDVRLTARLAQLEIDQDSAAAISATGAHVDSIINIARKKSMRWHLASALILRGASSLSSNHTDDAEPALLEAVSIARSISDRTMDWQAHSLLARLYERRLQYERALSCYRVAALTIHELAMNIVEERYRTSFLSQSQVKEVLERYERMRAEVGKRARYDIAALSRSEKISRKMLGALSAIGQKLTSILDLHELLGTLLDLSIENVRAERGIVFLRDDVTGEMRVQCARGMGEASHEEVASFSRSVVKRVAEGETLLTVDVGKDATLSAYESLALYEIKSILCVPMKARGKVIGVIYLDTRRAAQLFTDKERAFIESFAGQAAISVENARLFTSMNTENVRLRSEVEGRNRFENLVGGTSVMRKLVATINSVLASDCNVLIVGESGTGKELVAKAIHYNGPRRKKQFLAVDCGALPENLLEAELFGHARGAFTGADRDRVGLIQEADSGTLFLDEIANTSLALQARLLRVLQEHEVRRLGENATRRVDVRILAATNADLPGLITQGRFRQDLYYRLNVVTIEVPPLRERREDIPLLVDHLLRVRSKKGRPIKPLGPGILAALSRYDWPGNVRELENVIERLSVLSPGNVATEADLPAGFQVGVVAGAFRADGSGNGHKTGEQLMIEDALRRFSGDKAKAARFIGWNRQKLYRRMKAFRIAADYGQVV